MPATENYSFYPIFLNIHHKHVLVIGAGQVALRKITSLLRHEPYITIVAPQIHQDIYKLDQSSSFITLKNKEFEPSDFKLQHYILAYAVTNNTDLNKEICRLAMEKNILINSANDADSSSFIVPAVAHYKGDLQIAVSTGGTSPLLAKLVRIEIEKTLEGIDDDYTKFLVLAREFIKNEVPDIHNREELFHSLVENLDVYTQWKKTGKIDGDKILRLIIP